MLLLVLRPGGMLALNVVARTSSLLDDLIVAVKNAFSQGDEEEKKRRSSDCVSSTSTIIESSKVYILKVSDETVNTTLLMIKGGSLTEVNPIQPVTSSSKSVGGKIKATVLNAPADSLKLRMHRENAIEDWLKVSDNRGRGGMTFVLC